MAKSPPKLTKQATNSLIDLLFTRFERHPHRHPHLQWPQILSRLQAQPQKLSALNEMELTGGEPDVVGINPATSQFLYFDCAPETPQGRRSLCYDQEALLSRKEHKPATSAVQLASSIGIELLTEEQYRYLQTLESFDIKTSSWIQTPHAIRKLGGALFCDRRYDHVFTYHNGAQSYYAARGFRGCLKL